MIVWTAFLLIPAVALLVWLIGVISYSRNGRKPMHWAAIGLLIYGIAAVFGVFLMGSFNIIPSWAGPEGYGLLVPLLVGFLAIIASAVIGGLNLLISRYRRSRF